MTPHRQKLALVGSHIAVATITALLIVAFYPKTQQKVDEEYFRPIVEDAVGILARAKKLDPQQVRERYTFSLLELSDQLCIGFDQIAAVLDGSDLAVCYPKASPNAGPMFHERESVIPVNELNRQSTR